MDDDKRRRADTQWSKDKEKGGEEENVTKEGVLDEERRGLPSEHGESGNADQRMQTRNQTNGYYLDGISNKCLIRFRQGMKGKYRLLIEKR